MGVTTEHPLYLKRKPEWVKMRHCLEGEMEIKKQGTLYLPKSSGQYMAEKKLGACGVPASSGPYEAAKSMARFPEMLEAAQIGFVGIATRVPWNIEGLPAALSYLERDAGCGIPLEQWQTKIIAEGIAIGRYGLFPDAPVGGGDAKLQWYPAESIINWKNDALGGMTLAVLCEYVDSSVSDEFSHEQETRYRVIRMIDGKATVSVYDEHGVPSGEQDAQLSDWFPLTIGGVKDNGSYPDRPPLAGLADSMLSYYRLSASHRWAIRQTCDPTLLALGFKEGEVAGVGAGMIVEKDAKPNDASMAYVEIKGTGLAHVKDEMDAELDRAVAQTHKLVERVGVEASDTVRQRIGSKTASLRNVDKNGAKALQDALNQICRMNKLPETVEVTSSTDYTDEDIDSTVLSALVQSVGLRQLPGMAVREYIRKRGLLESLDDDEILEMIESEREDAESQSVGFGDDGIVEDSDLNDDGNQAAA